MNKQQLLPGAEATDYPTTTVFVVLCGAVAAPLAGGAVVLLATGLAGTVGLPGAVVGYLALTGLVLSCLTVPVGLRQTRRVAKAKIVGLCGAVAGAALAIAGAAPSKATLIVAILVAGLVAGPMLGLSRAVLASAGPQVHRFWHAAALVGLAAAAALAAASSEHPATGLAVAGGSAALLSLAVVAVPGQREQLPDPHPAEVPLPGIRMLCGYAAAGIAVGGTLLPATHLLLF